MASDGHYSINSDVKWRNI